MTKVVNWDLGFGHWDFAMLNLLTIFKIINSVSKKTKTPIYVVGGFVRDFLMGSLSTSILPSGRGGGTQDIDFVVLGSGLEFAKKFDSAMKKEGSLIEFPDFDTARYVIEEIIIEFAGARSEAYKTGSRKPKVVSAGLEEDLSRRDFTVNAMAAPASLFAQKKISLEKIKKSLADPFGGIKHIKEKILKTPLDPDKTFRDDPLRMLRAIRFASQLDFSIDPEALKSIHKNREEIKIISAERIKEEFFKMMACDKPSTSLILLFQTKLLDIILPEVARLQGVEEIYGHQHKENLIHTFKVADNIAERSKKVLLRLAGLFHDIGKADTKKFVPKIGWTFYQHEHVGKKLVYQIGRRLRFSKEETNYLAKLVRWHQQPISLMDEGITDSAVRRIIVNLGEELNDLLILGRSDITTGNPLKKEKRLGNYDRLEKRIAEVLEKDKLRAFQSPLRGDEIMKLAGLKAGPTIGRIKKAIEEAILDGKIPNDYEASKNYFNEIRGEYLKSAQDWEKIN